MRHKFLKSLTTTFLLLLSFYGYSQSLDQARKMYNEGLYEDAKPAFERLVKQSPSNPSYNLWYGVCCYETGDLEGAEKYLLVANKRKDVESSRYLAMLYSGLFHYDEAIKMWEEYIAAQSKKKEDTSFAEAELDRSRNLLRMQNRAEDVQVIDSVVLSKDAFLEVYSLSEESGTIVPYSSFFDSGNDISSIVYTNQKGNTVYYARPAENGNYSIYSQSKLIDTWGDEKALLTDDNGDNNYPFVLSDGVTIYFASKGYESIGGYDIFVSRYSTNTNSYLVPEQMGMPFNSIANDYMMVIDESKGLGWFVTDRNQPEDHVCVYLFIPDPSRKRIEDIEDVDLLRNRALLTSISDTWRENSNYDELIKLAYKDNNGQNNIKKERDFEFVINNNVTYYTLNEIKSHEAKELYSEVININKQIDALKSRLDNIRDSYSKGNASAREQLAPTILQAENQLYTLMESAVIQEKKARNAENSQLGVNNK